MPIVDYNSQITEVLGYRNLLQLRQELMVRLGFAAQVSTPPTGMTELLNSFLQGANRTLFLRPSVPRQSRIYTWTLANGVRFYGLQANEEVTNASLKLSQYKVSWVGIERDGVWTELKHGISPENYTHDLIGFPCKYQIKQSIEIWPTPDSTVQYLRVVGSFGLEPFVDDDDYPTVDDELVFLLALYNAKSHYGQGDANNALQQMEAMLRGLVAGTHQTATYVNQPAGLEQYVEPKPSVPFP